MWTTLAIPQGVALIRLSEWLYGRLGLVNDPSAFFSPVCIEASAGKALNIRAFKPLALIRSLACVGFRR